MRRWLDHPAWPHVRAILIALHVLSLVVLSLPTAGAIHDRRRWQTANARDDLRRMAARLTAWGLATDEHQLEQALWSAGDAYLRVQRPIAAPFQRYAELTGSRQAWQMFASPQRHPAEVHVDIELSGPAGSQWQLLYRPHSDEHAWNREQFDHNRFRKFFGRFARGFIRSHYDQSARWIATKAAREHPEASRVRVRLARYETLPPERVRAGERPALDKYEHERVFDAEALR
ncbi:hypothetical protein [Paraliomyxa miuraensis]|uniref:hypothetical protein n=1 Tax=Paraliomyxa miuraensis TaxID=376150 RepID=UPI002258CB92|nr:hypothetical protein [Paraliomyxa miuraensis]MCX4240612.1 hypothetical protein [Paraliomyxa miuraensis]